MNAQGGYELTHLDRTVTVLFRWEAIDRLIDLWGDTYLERVNRAFEVMPPRDLAVLLVLSTDLNRDEVYEWRPPGLILKEVLEKAWGHAWLGEERLNAALEVSKKTDPKIGRPLPPYLVWLQRLSSKLGEAGRNSGSSPQVKPGS